MLYLVFVTHKHSSTAIAIDQQPRSHQNKNIIQLNLQCGDQNNNTHSSGRVSKRVALTVHFRQMYVHICVIHV